jgi:hypothetical protein
MKWIFRIAALAALIAALAFEAEGGAVCGTSDEVNAAAAQLDARVRARMAAVRMHADSIMPEPSTTRVIGEYFAVRADEETAPNDDPADLEGHSLYLQRRDANYVVTRQPLQYDMEIGPLFVSFGRGETSKELPLTEFAFPFGDHVHSSVTLSVVRGIHFTEDPKIRSATFSEFDMLLSKVPVLSPLIDYHGSPSTRPDVYVRETGDRVTITWRHQGTARSEYDLQAVLFASGDIRFSYRRVRNIGWGGVVVNTGTDHWLQNRKGIAGVVDGTGDVDSSFGDARGMLDITDVFVGRIDDTSLLEFRIRVAEPIDPAKFEAGASFLFFIGDSLNRIEMFVYPDRTVYRVPVAGEVTEPRAARIIGREVILFIPEELLQLSSRTVKVWAHTSLGSPADMMTATIDLGPKRQGIEVDFSEVSTFETERPLVEAYRLATINVNGVWDRLKREFGYADQTVDAVAVYTSFLSDIILEPYGAFALYANPGADGVSGFSSTMRPRSTTLMHMNAVGSFGGGEAQKVLLHELGHRWLYYFNIREDGEIRRVLNPLGNHPAQYVHTPAAFGGEESTSAMGGGSFVDAAQGKFRSSSALRNSGLTWHELYLMGLAAPSEVEPWWYIRDADPQLGDEYFPPPDMEVTGTRVDVSIDQIIDAMGPRVPSYENSQKTFHVLFVVLERAGSPVQSVDEKLRTDFEVLFNEATGGRGSVITTLSLAAPGASFDVATSGSSVTFTDRSAQVPLSWAWSFGDGAMSTARNPVHTYAAPGTYTVTLTVTNNKGTSSTSRIVTIDPPSRRRAAKS